MSDKLKQFVTKRRQDFDSSEPGSNVWDKIDAHMEAKKAAGISSSWLSKFKYLGFSLSVLVMAIYLLSKNLNSAPVSQHAAKKDPHADAITKKPSAPDAKNNVTKVNTVSSAAQPNALVSSHKQTQAASVPDNLPDKSEDDISIADLPANKNTGEEKQEPEIVTNPTPPEIPAATEKNTSSVTSRRKKTGIHLPEEPAEINTFTGTLYDAASLCAVLRAYKFPGKVNMHTGELQNQKKISLRTTSCSILENEPAIKAVWLKGKTDKKMTIAIKKKFKNILLVKKDGREYTPAAISHYYPGLGVISEFTGIYFNLVFNEKVELILFFEDAEEGDKIVIDGILEALVTKQP